MHEVQRRAHISSLEQGARRHERRFEFDEAAHLYFRAAMLEESGANNRFFDLMRAASCKERAQNWRQHTGLWERLAYELAKSAGVKFPPPMESFRARRRPGQLGLFHIISYDEWMKPTSELVHLVKGEEEKGLRQLQRAWAYQWGAEEAEANGRLGHAARLWRLAGLSFAADDCPLQDRFREATRAFLHGATCTLRAGDWVPMMFVATVAWDSRKVEWGDPKTGTEADDPEPGTEKCQTDLQWHQYAWRQYLESIKDSPSVTDALEEQARELNQLQQLLITAGDRTSAVQVYRERMQVQLKKLRLCHQRVKLLFNKLYNWTSLSGSSVRRALTTAFVANVVILPVLYWSTGVALAGTSGQHRATFPQTLIMSLASVVSLSSSSAHVIATWASALQALQAVGGYFLLAFIVWVAQRFHG